MSLTRLGPLLGHVTTDRARVFVRLKAGEPGPVVARSRVADETGPSVAASTCELPRWPGGDGTFVGDVPLPGGPGVLHEVTLAAGDADLGRVVVRGAEPASATGRIAFAFGSCWKVDAVGRPEATWEMLEALARARVVDHLLLLGDQIYADLTPLPARPAQTASSAARELGPASPLSDRVAAYREAYQRAWAVPALREAQGMLPVASIWDDHEITNGYGSLAEHGRPEWQAVFEAAAAGFDEFQGSRNPERLATDSRGWAFRRGPAAFVGLDLRTHRSYMDQRLLGDEQKHALRAWLEGEARQARVLVLACSVPPMHMPRIISMLHGISDVRDQWEMTCKPDRRWLIQRLRDFEEGGRRRAIILGGDAHLATALTLRDASGHAMWQLTSSPLAQRLPTFVYPALTMLGRAFHVRTDSGERLAARIEHRWRGPNVGIVHGRVSEDRVELVFELQRPGRRGVAIDLSARLSGAT